MNTFCLVDVKGEKQDDIEHILNSLFITTISYKVYSFSPPDCSWHDHQKEDIISSYVPTNEE